MDNLGQSPIVYKLYLALFAGAWFWAVYRLAAMLGGFLRGRASADRKHYNGVEPFESLAPLLDFFKPLSGLLGSQMAEAQVAEMEKGLKNAGLSFVIGVGDLVGLRLVAITLGTISGLLGGWFILGWNPMLPAVAVVVGVIGWIYPSVWLDGKVTEYQRAIFRGLSDTLDVISVSVQAGLDLRSALERSVNINSEPVLDNEIKRMLDEVNVGGKSFRQAIEALSSRVNMPEMTAFCSVLQMTFHYGGSRMSEILVEQATSIRQDRVLRAENYINQVSSKLLFPIVVFIMPAVLVTLLGPMGLEAYIQMNAK